MVEPIIQARGLTKRYGAVTAVDGIDFDIAPGESFGFLGPNGAGKSTTMRMIAATSTRTGGTLQVLGMDTDDHGPEIRAKLGIVPQGDLLDEELRVIDNLIVYGRYFGLPRAYVKKRAEELLDFAQLREKRTARVDGLSGGMKRRLTIARGLINNPRVMLLDEPTTGLDPQARHILWDRLFRLKEAGTTLVVTTHFMDEAEQLCDRLMVVDKGRIVAEGSPSDLIRDYCTREVLEVRFGSGHNADAAAVMHGIGHRQEILADRVLIYADDGDHALQRVLDAGLSPVASLVRRSSLEDVFLRLTGRSLIE